MAGWQECPAPFQALFLYIVKQAKMSGWSTYPAQWSTIHCRRVIIDCGSALDVQFSGHFPGSSQFLTCPDRAVSWRFKGGFPFVSPDSSRAIVQKFTIAVLPFVCLMANTACIHLAKKYLVVNCVPMFDDKLISAVFHLTKLLSCSWGGKLYVVMSALTPGHPLFSRRINISVNFSLSRAYFIPVIVAGCNMEKAHVPSKSAKKKKVPLGLSILDDRVHMGNIPAAWTSQLIQRGCAAKSSDVNIIWRTTFILASWLQEQR